MIVRRARKILQPVYEEMQEHLRNSAPLTPEETGWRIGGRPAWLHHGAGDDGATLYAIDPQPSARVLCHSAVPRPPSA
jgi:transposase